MKGTWARLCLPIFLLVFPVLGCENIFTYSPLEGLRRDVSKLPVEQRIELAQSAINSGDVDAMIEVYDDLKASKDPTVMPVAADLAISISGVPSAVTDILGQAATVDFENEDELQTFTETAQTRLDSVDETKVTEAVDLIEATEKAGGTVSPDQYAMAAVGLAVKVAKDVGDVEVILSEDSEVSLTADQQAQLDKAEAYLAKSGYDLESLGFGF